MATRDKYAAVWVSHSSMGDYLKCPRAYFLHNIYRSPESGRKIGIVSPALSLGQAVHTTLENLKHVPVEERLSRDLLADYEESWAAVSGKTGGFVSPEEEAAAKARGKAMIERVTRHPGPIAEKTVKLPESRNNMPPNVYLSEDEGIILCGLIDWIQYIEADDSVRIIDFKTGKREEEADSLQLPIYLLLLDMLQKRPVSGAAYWYLEYDDEPRAVALPQIDEARERVLHIARQVVAARKNNEFHCPCGARGCFACRPYEDIIAGRAEYVGVVGYGVDAYRV